MRLRQSEAQLKVTHQGLEQAKVQLASATTSFERTKNLFAKGALAQMEFEQSANAFKMASVSVQSAEAQVALAGAAVALAASTLDDTRIARRSRAS